MLREVDQDIWVAEQPLRYFGLSIGTRMTVIRLANRELVVISPIQINAPTANQLSNLGKLGHIVAPNLYHYFFAAEFKAFYPDATFWAAPGLKTKQPELPIDRIIDGQILDGKTNNQWDGLETVLLDGFRTLSLSGFNSLNECVFFHSASRTLILTDAAFHFDESFPMLTQFASRVTGGYKRLCPSLLEKIATKEKESVRQSAEKVLRWDFERVIMAHGSIIERHGKERFRQGYSNFLGQR